jgi:hypothetical protein
MSRLRKKLASIGFYKKAEDDDMSFDEIKEVVLQAINNMGKMTDKWAIRDTLKDITSWGFYKGEQMAIVDEKEARNICKQLRDYVTTLNSSHESILMEIADKVERYAYNF